MPGDEVDWNDGEEMTMLKWNAMTDEERVLWAADSLRTGHRKFRAIGTDLGEIKGTLTSIDDTLKQLPCKSNPGYLSEVGEHVADETIHQKKINWNEVIREPKVITAIIVSAGTLITLITAIILKWA